MRTYVKPESYFACVTWTFPDFIPEKHIYVFLWHTTLCTLGTQKIFVNDAISYLSITLQTNFISKHPSPIQENHYVYNSAL